MAGAPKKSFSPAAADVAGTGTPLIKSSREFAADDACGWPAVASPPKRSSLAAPVSRPWNRSSAAEVRDASPPAALGWAVERPENMSAEASAAEVEGGSIRSPAVNNCA